MKHTLSRQGQDVGWLCALTKTAPAVKIKARKHLARWLFAAALAISPALLSG